MAQTTGTLVSKVSSTVSNPTVNYSATYTATRETTSTAAVSVALTFSAWLNSIASTLGTGIKLTVYARMNGGAWSSTVIKATSVSWSGTTKHTANITLTGNVTSNKTKIDFYVTRSGSSYSGAAGKLGSASSPKSYTATIPTYGGGGGGNAPDNKDDKYICVKINGTWEQAIPYVKVNGTWKKAVPYIKISGTWKLT